MLPLQKAIIMVMDPPLTRSAALVYRTPTGIGWVEPEYFEDPPPARRAWHQVDGPIAETPNGAFIQGPDQSVLVLDAALVAGTDLDYPQARKDFAELEAKLKARGTSLAEQRVILAGELPVSG